MRTRQGVGSCHFRATTDENLAILGERRRYSTDPLPALTRKRPCVQAALSQFASRGSWVRVPSSPRRCRNHNISPARVARATSDRSATRSALLKPAPVSPLIGSPRTSQPFLGHPGATSSFRRACRWAARDRASRWGLDSCQMAERRKPKTALLNSTGRSTHGR
jgi:hypothetical protein